MGPLRRLYKRSHRLRRFIRRRKDAVTYYLTRFGLWLPRLVSLPRALGAADRIGDIIYYVLPKPRRWPSSIWRSRSATRCRWRPASASRARRFATRRAASSSWPSSTRSRRASTTTSPCKARHWEALRELGRGGIVITGHIGNWELLGAYFARQGLPIAAIARRINDSRLNQLLVDFRTRSGVHTILRESPTSSREILKILNERGVLALIIDQDINAQSVSVPFFGRLARTPAAAASLAARRDLPVVPIFAQRRPEGGHRFTCMAPIFPPKSGNRRRDILELTHQFSKVLEDRIRQNPAEWVWWHRRWRRRPVPRLDLDSEIQYRNPVLP